MAETAAPRIALVALDLDDTLLAPDLTIPDQSKRAIRKAWESGVKVTIATGRMFCSALPYAQDLGLDVPLITYNGALVKCTATGREVFRAGVPRPLAERIVTFCETRGLTLNVYLDDRLYVARRTPDVDYYEEIAGVRAEAVGDLKHLLSVAEDGEPAKLLVVATTVTIEALREELGVEYAGELNVTRSRPRFLEITRAGVDKGAAVTRLAQELGVPMSAVMAVGDSLNDVEMLRAVGWAVAVSHAPEVLRREADYVTTAGSGYAVAEAMARFVLR